MHRLFLCGNGSVCNTASAKFRVIGIKHLDIIRVIRNADFVNLVANGLEIAHNNKFFLIAGNSPERDNAVLVILRGNPVEALPACVAFPKRGIIEIELIYRLDVIVISEVRLKFQNLPIELRLEIPLLVLSKFLSHKHQLLAGVRHHISEERSHRMEAELARTAHFIEHRAFSVDNLVVAYRENEILRERIIERERHKIVVIGSAERVHTHISEHIVHPAHIPLEVEPKSADIRRLRNHRPRGRFFRNHKNIRVFAEKRGVQLLEERDCFEIFPAALVVRTPFAVAAVIVEIEH